MDTVGLRCHLLVSVGAFRSIPLCTQDSADQARRRGPAEEEVPSLRPEVAASPRRREACKGLRACHARGKLGGTFGLYEGLGIDYMSHWALKHHTTTDVVRHAIIPLSAPHRCALAPVLMGKRARPAKMVTHNWGNLFRGLVAAICADALDEDEFGPIAYLLEHDFSELRDVLRREGCFEKTYWVCPFSVNQHVTICGKKNPLGSRDSFIGELYPLCTCGASTLYNDAPPLSSEGQSIPCEVNKFDSMMTALAASDPDFGLVGAIDGKFELFGPGAWLSWQLRAVWHKAMSEDSD